MAINQLIAVVTVSCLAGFMQIAKAQTQVPNEFQAGQPARASEVNENFDVLEQAIQDLELSSSSVAIQVQSAIDVASEARWLVADYYSRAGNWPIDNVEAGAELASFYTNGVVISVDVSLNDVTATFGRDAVPELDGETITFIGTDNLGSVEFICLVSATIEALLPDGYCTFVDRPPTKLQTIRNQVTSAIALASEARWLVEDFRRNTGTFPLDNAEAGAPGATAITNDVVASVAVTPGEVTATFSLNANANIVGDSIVFEATDNGGSITWACRTSLYVPRYVPQMIGGTSCIEFPDSPPLPVTLVRRQVASAFPSVNRLQSAAENYYSANGTWPNSNAQAGEPPADQFRGYAFNSIEVLSDGTGTIVVTYGAEAHAVLPGNQSVFVPTDTGANIIWTCQSTSIPQRFLPYECKD